MQNEKRKNKGITLIELIIAITLVGMVALTAGTIEIWARRMGAVQDKQTELLNRISPVMEQIAKDFYVGIGNKSLIANSSASNSFELIMDQEGWLSFSIKQDTNPPIGEFNQDNDMAVVYRYNKNGHTLERAVIAFANRNNDPPFILLAKDVELEIRPANVDYDSNGDPANDTQLIYDITLRTRQNMDPNVGADPITNPEVELTTRIACREESIS